ncbi:hypothetical protein V6N13_090499 [Hibiscus sabdariffa]|uniref:Uncharacterized protein n=1 Tax=Hibiscus sabdariffa TaxID=183260 RepID=A0ABR2C068_9ROSI
MATSSLKTTRIPLTSSPEKGHFLPIKTSVTVASKLKKATFPLQVLWSLDLRAKMMLPGCITLSETTV